MVPSSIHDPRAVTSLLDYLYLMDRVLLSTGEQFQGGWSSVALLSWYGPGSYQCSFLFVSWQAWEPQWSLGHLLFSFPRFFDFNHKIFVLCEFFRKIRVRTHLIRSWSGREWASHERCPKGQVESQTPSFRTTREQMRRKAFAWSVPKKNKREGCRPR